MSSNAANSTREVRGLLRSKLFRLASIPLKAILQVLGLDAKNFNGKSVTK